MNPNRDLVISSGFSSRARVRANRYRVARMGRQVTYRLYPTSRQQAAMTETRRSTKLHLNSRSGGVVHTHSKRTRGAHRVGHTRNGEHDIARDRHLLAWLRVEAEGPARAAARPPRALSAANEGGAIAGLEALGARPAQAAAFGALCPAGPRLARAPENDRQADARASAALPPPGSLFAGRSGSPGVRRERASHSR